MNMDQVKSCGTVLLTLTVFLASIATVGGLECYTCNSLGLGDSHSNEACVTFDISKIGKEPCQVPEGKVGKCQKFQGSVTVDAPWPFEAQTASGTYLSCAVFDSDDVTKNGCFEATDIPDAAVSTVFTVTSLIGLEQSVKGTTCYCSKDNCNGGAIPSASINLIILLVVSLAFIWSM